MKKFLTLMMAMMLTALSMVPAFAAVNPGDSSYNAWSGTVNGPSITIDKYYIFPHDTAEVPENEVTYTLSIPDTSVDEGAIIKEGDEDYVTLYNGILNGVKVMGTTGKTGTMTFTEDENGTSGTETGYTRKTGDTDDTASLVDDSMDYIKKPISIDFTGVTFTEPGVYRYWLQESSSNQLVVNDTELASDTDNQTWRTIDVYVVDSNDGNGELSVDTVVYQGKLTATDQTDQPKTEADDTDPYDSTTFDVGDYTELADTTWTYTDASGNKYEYKYDKTKTKSSIGWYETYTPSGDSAQTPRERTTWLDQSTGSPSGKTYQSDEYGTLKSMGAKDTVLQGKEWTYTDSSGVVHTYYYDSSVSQWVHKATDTTQAAEDKPDDDAKSEDGVHPDLAQTAATVDLTYKQAADANPSETYYLNELTSHVWYTENTTTGVTKKWTYNITTGKWDVTVITDNNEEPDDAATTSDSSKITVDPVNYTYVLALAQATDEANYDGTVRKPNPNGAEAGNKTDHYLNEYEAFNLTIKKEVKGNQGSRDKYFMFTITLENAGAEVPLVLAGNYLDVVPSYKTQDVVPNTATDPSYTYKKIIDAHTNSGNASLGDYYKTEDDGTKTLTFYLKNGDDITIQGVKKGAKYTITEEDGEKEGYTTTAVVESGDELDGDKTSTTKVTYASKVMTDSSLQEGTVVKYTNKRSGVIPTGVLMSVAGGVALVVIAAVALMYLNRRREVEE